MADGSMVRCCAPMAAWSELQISIEFQTSIERIRVMKQVIVITGASSGFGRLSANALAKAGHTVYASMRGTTGRNAAQVADVEKFARDNGVDLRAIELDVGSQESVDAAIARIVAEQGRLDVVIHNAGHGVRAGGGVHPRTTRGTLRHQCPQH